MAGKKNKDTVQVLWIGSTELLTVQSSDLRLDFAGKQNLMNKGQVSGRITKNALVRDFFS
jgi:hypothetical protein